TAGSTESVAVISVSVPGQRVPNQQIVITRNEVNIPPPPGGGGVGGGGGASTPRPDMEGFDDWVRPAGGTVGGMGWINGRWHMGSDFYGSNGTVFNAVAPGTVMRIHRYASTGDRHRLVIMHEGHFVVGDRVYNRIWTAYQVYTGGVIFQNIQPGMQVTTTTNLGQVGAGLPLHFEVRTTGPTTADNQTGNILATAADTSTAPVIDPRWIFS
ncbi:MAG: hypothetical protein FWE38_02700, partial [Firmicutes bacterium]|nr:hypothetical protein [Bacillota bacterium]